ncbi:DUF4253 domain-containing protein [Pseudanabaena sp. FACHB-1998]|nr:DUF4253 domain-containing protein [Pseudanabaena sp. FACHB-1998]
MTTNLALAIAVNLENSLEAWHLLRNLLPQTQRYPVITACWHWDSGSWQQTLNDEDFFSRFYFGEEYPNLDLSPQAIIARANSVTPQELDNFLDERAQINTYDLEEQILIELANTSSTFGEAPLNSELQELVRLGLIANIIDVEKYLFDWELQQITEISAPSSHEMTYLDWFQPTGQTMALMLLPTSHSWETLAYLSWYGGSKGAIPLLKKWHQLYGAELVCHYGTMLQLLISKRPSTPQEAFTLASEQVLLAPCTTLLSGVSIRDHARSLLQTDRWFLHERP